MSEPLIVDKYEPSAVNIQDMDMYVLKNYDQIITYYWNASSSNKRTYKRFKTWSIILSAVLTVISAISISDYISSNLMLDTVFTMAIPILAATLMITIGYSQNFQWGATWREMVINAQRLQRERDRFLTTDPKNRDYQQELKIINEMILEETQAFFQRIGT